MSRSGDAMLSRLRSIARERQVSTEHMLTRWVAERFLFRLATSEQSGRFILKGGYLFTLWGGESARTTSDVDLHADEDGLDTGGRLLSVMADEALGEDGITFNCVDARTSTLVGGGLPGLRMVVDAEVGSARPKLRVDVGYGHPITPGVEVGWYSSFVPGFDSFPIRAYPRPTVIAEKLAVAVEFGRDNTRLRDYYDLWHLSQRYSYFGHVLLEAVERTFAARDAGRFVRRTDGYWERAFSQEFATNRVERAWSNWIEEHAPRSEGLAFCEVLHAVEEFGVPILEAVRDGQAMRQRWTPGSGWRRSYK